jgi:23S rRNA pseudouridine955/2504/2580 synthase
MSGVSTVTVEVDEAGIRLDRWFRRHYPALGHGQLEKLLRTGQVRVEGGRVRSATRLEAGQAVRVPPLGEAAEMKPVAREPRVSGEDAAFIQSLVIHQDEHVIAINKPPGLAVQGGSKVSRHVDGMLDALRFKAKERPKLVHRLDKDTGGLLLLARSSLAAAKLAEAFRGREVDKTYWALVSGLPNPPVGRIDAALIKAGSPGNERMQVNDDGKWSITDYAVIENAGKRVSWLALKPVSGRTHQLRVHCAQIGTPILGDAKYGGEASDLEGLPDGRCLHLHARALSVPHPAGGTLRLIAPLHESMERSWGYFAFDPTRAPDPFAVPTRKRKRK